MIRRKFVYELGGIFLNLLITLTIFSQTDTHNFYRINSLSNIPQKDVICLFQDSKGFTWLGTLDGLHRYDGYSYKTYRMKEDANSISSNMIADIDEDSHGNLWIGTFDKGLCKFNPVTDQFTSYSNNISSRDEKINYTISFLLVDNNDVIWFGDGEILTRIKCDENMDKPIEIQNILSNEIKEGGEGVSTIHQDKEGQIWTGTNGHAYRLINPYAYKDDIQFEAFECNTENIIDFESGILVGGFNISAIQKDKSTNKYKLTVLSNTTVQEFLYKDETIWNGTRNGIICFNYFPEKGWIETKRFDKNFSDKSLNSNIVTSLISDRLGQIWVGTRGGGVNIISQTTKKFEHYKRTPNKGSLANNLTRAMFEDHKNNFWIGTEETGVSLLHHSKKNNYETGFKHITVNDFMQYDRVYAIEESFTPHSKKQKSIIWLGTTFYQNLIALNPETHKLKSFSEFFRPPLQVFTIEAQNDTTLWVGTYGRGVWRLKLDRDGNITNMENIGAKDKKTVQISSLIIRYIFMDKEGNIWIATDKGLNLIEKQETLKKNPQIKVFKKGEKNNGITHNYLLQITQTKDGSIWIGTMGGGLLKCEKHNDDYQFTSFTTKDGLPNNSIKSIIEDDNGYLWLASNNGLSRFDPRNNDIINYDKNDGLQDNEFSEICAYKRSNGQLVFGGNNGFNVFYPNQIAIDTVKPKMFLTDLYILNKKVEPLEEINGRILLDKTVEYKKSIELKYTENSFSIGYVALHYNTPIRNKYRYKLEGFDKDWVIGSPNYRIANYTNIPPGEYTFLVQGSNSDNIWADAPAKLIINVRPPFYKSTLAWLVYIIIGLIILFVAFKVFRTIAQKKKVEELSKMRLQFFTNISHEFRTPLTLINAPLEKLIKGENTISLETRKRYQNLIKRNANVLLRLINQLLDFRKLEHGKLKLNPGLVALNKFIDEIYQGFIPLAEQKRISFTYENSDEELILHLDKEKIEMALYNLLSNAFKFTQPEGKITIKTWLNKREQNVIISVEDNGEGIEKEAQQRIFERFYQQSSEVRKAAGGTGIGLELSKGFIEMHKGSLTFESEKDKGSIFYVRLPLNLKVDGGSKHQTQSKSTIVLESLPKKKKQKRTTSQIDELREFGQKHKILIVEDNIELRQVVAELFEDNFIIVEAGDGVEGLELCRREQPDLVISDIMMPRMDGIELCKTIKFDEEISHIPVIILTAKDTVESQIEGYKTGADLYVSKPFTSDILIAQVASIIKQREVLRKKFQNEVEISPMIISNSPADKDFLDKILEIIEENLSNLDFNIEKLADIYGVSRTYLNRKIKALTGETSNQFLRNIRLKHAAELLKQNKLNVSEVTWQVGYNDPKVFRKWFKEKFGVSPSEFVRNTN